VLLRCQFLVILLGTLLFAAILRGADPANEHPASATKYSRGVLPCVNLQYNTIIKLIWRRLQYKSASDASQCA